MSGAAVAVVGLSLLLASRAAAQVPVWRPLANPDPLRAASLPFEEADAGAPPAGRWAFSFETAYFNVWSVTARTGEIHKQYHREGLPLSDAELRELERRYPTSTFQHLDLEGVRSDLFVSRGLGHGVALTLHVPWLEIGRPRWDDVAEFWHRVLGMPHFYRNVFARGDTLVYLKTRAGLVERRDLDGSGLGDVELAASLPGGRWAGADHRLVLAVEAPTGDRSGLRGSGGWDTGVRWFSDWRLGRVDVVGGLGFTRLARNGSLLGLERFDPWHVMIGADWRLRPELTAYARATLERPIWGPTMDHQAGQAALFRRFGLAGPVSRDLWLAFDIGQDDASNGVAPDYSFHLTLGTRR